MKLEDAKKTALKLMKEYDLHYKIFFYRPTKAVLKKFNLSNHAMGFCTDKNRKIIALNKLYVLAVDEDTLIEIIKHEIAHAIEFTFNNNYEIGHGKVWQKIAKNIGIRKPSATKELSLIEELRLFYYTILFHLDKI